MRENSQKYIESIEKNDPTLKECIFMNECFSFEELNRLKHAFENNTNLIDVSLVGTKVGDEGIVVLSAFLRVNRSLRRLSLSTNNISDIGLKSLIDNLENNTDSALEILDLTYNKITQAGAVFLKTYLRKTTTLKFLALCNNNIGVAGAKCLCEALKENVSLQELRIQSTNCFDEGGKAIIDLLQVNKTLRSVELYGNFINLNIIKEINILVSKNAANYINACKGAFQMLFYTRNFLSTSPFTQLSMDLIALILSYTFTEFQNSLTQRQILNISFFGKDKKTLGTSKERFLEQLGIGTGWKNILSPK